MTGDWPCPRCHTDSVLAVLRLPHTWTNKVQCISEILLCARCDANDPLVTFFTVHGTARPDNALQLARALQNWAANARPPKPDENALVAETEAWHRGDL
ncbi:DUF6300 family protein [Nonomuraea sediminis]|uniref:DUF6300 family protein n=1 Tax=Nonomuraea sediminis TaxID=2835864 RepID=UPI001BDC3FB0|nr:DUF6300 family protein [Nonomuraea sediminis]